jgi:tRNA threonylcarbamoyladenosine biosynthesis protein TsaB
MLTLGIETSGWEGSIALLRNGALVAERALSRTGRRHARTLVSELRELLASASATPRDVELVAVSVGPGSFTGLRVGVVCAKTFAYATGCTVVGVDTFEAIAAGSPSDVDRVVVLADAQRGDLYAGRYARSATRDEWRREGEIEIQRAEEFIAGLPRDTVVTGPGAARCSAALEAVARVLPAESGVPRAADVAAIGERRALAGETDDVWRLEPVYVRKSGAEEKLEALSR